MDGWMDGWMDGCIEGRMDGCIEGRIEGRKADDVYYCKIHCFSQIAFKGRRYRKCDGFVSRNDGEQNVPAFMEHCGVISFLEVLFCNIYKD